MGLDIVELIMRMEEEFAIEIPDSEAELLTTPGMLCELIEHKLSRVAPLYPTTRTYCPTSRAFYAVRRELMQLGIERHRVTPQTSMATLWPHSERRHQWNSLGEALNFELPPLRRSSEWAFVGLLPLGIFPIWLAVSPDAAVPFLALYALLWWSGSYLTRPFAIHAPAGIRSIADLAHRLSLRYCASDAGATPDLWFRVRALIADECGMTIEQVIRDSDFYRDLGLG